MKNQITAILAACMMSATAFADDISLGEPRYGGTGCPKDSASVALSPDGKAISILFDQYVVEAGGAKLFDRKSCDIAIPIQVPSGYSVSVLSIDYRGFAGLPSGGSAQLNVHYFMPGSAGVRTSKTFYGLMSTDYLKSDRLGIEALVWSPCGAATNLRASTTLLVRSNSRREQAMATVDSADVQAGLIYHLQFRRCN